jgi:hypothetical protein
MPAAKVSARQGVVRLTLPAAVANDLDGLQKSLASLAERMGHPSCATGCDVLFLQTEREFGLNAALELNPQPLPPHGLRGLPTDPVPVLVNLPARLGGNIDTLKQAVAATVEKLGCGKCCSGFDIAFRQELDLIAFDARGKLQGFGRFA